MDEENVAPEEKDGNGESKSRPVQYDGAFRLLFGHKRVFLDLLQGFVDVPEFQDVELKSLHRVQARQVSSRLQQRENDALWKVTGADGKTGLLYVMVEYQQRQHRLIATRLWEYQAIITNALASKPECLVDDKVPQILPVVLYHGKSEWAVPQDVAGEIRAAFPGTERYKGTAPYVVIDVRRTPALKEALGNLADIAFRFRRMKRSDMKSGKRDARLLEEWLAGEEWEGLRTAFVTYITEMLRAEAPSLTVGEVTTIREVIEVFEDEGPNWEEHIEARGKAIGEARGEARGKAIGEARGKAIGEKRGYVKALVAMARDRFDESCASALASFLGSTPSPAVLDEAGKWVLRCDSAQTFLGKVRAA